MRKANPRTHGALVAGLSALSLALGHLQAVLSLLIWRLLQVTPDLPQVKIHAVVKEAPDWLGAAAQGGQVALVIVLLIVAWLVGRSPLERLGSLFYVLGVTLGARYVALILLVGWPLSWNVDDTGFWPPDLYAPPVWILLVTMVIAVSCGLGLITVARRKMA